MSPLLSSTQEFGHKPLLLSKPPTHVLASFGLLYCSFIAKNRISLCTSQLISLPEKRIDTSSCSIWLGPFCHISKWRTFTFFFFFFSWPAVKKHLKRFNIFFPLLLARYQNPWWYKMWKWSDSSSVVSNFLQSHGPYSPWNSPGRNTGVGSLSLLQGIFPTQGSNPGLPHCRWNLYQLSHKGSPYKKIKV